MASSSAKKSHFEWDFFCLLLIQALSSSVLSWDRMYFERRTGMGIKFARDVNEFSSCAGRLAPKVQRTAFRSQGAYLGIEAIDHVNVQV